MMHSELLPSLCTFRSEPSCCPSCSFVLSRQATTAATAQTLLSRGRRLKAGFDSGLLLGVKGGGSLRNAGLRASGGWDSKERTSGRRDSSGLFKIQVSEKMISSIDGDARVGDEEEEEDAGVVQILDRVEIGQEAEKGDEVVNVQIEKLRNNSRKIVAKIRIRAPLEAVWALLTDYEHLADFIPGLAVSELLEKRHNGARLYQVGEQNLAFGVKFKAKAVVDCEEKPAKVHQNVIRRDIDFETVEGDFQVFRGTWRMEQQVSETSPAPQSVGGVVEEGVTTTLSYILLVQPKMWLPVALVEGRLTREVKTNLVCIRDKSLQPSVS